MCECAAACHIVVHKKQLNSIKTSQMMSMAATKLFNSPIRVECDRLLEVELAVKPKSKNHQLEKFLEIMKRKHINLDGAQMKQSYFLEAIGKENLLFYI